MIFESIPYTNWHDINLDWILARMQEYMAKTDAAVQSIEDLEHYIREYLKSANMQELINNALGELNRAGQLGYLSGITQRNIRQWNPAADGVTDDTEVFNEAIQYCNEHGYDLVCNPEDTYLLRPDTPIPVRCSIDFRGATIIMRNTTGASRTLFNIRPSAVTSYTGLTAELFDQDGVALTGAASQLGSKVFRLSTPYVLGIRSGGSSSDNAIYYRQTFITDGQGKFINAPFYAKIYGATPPESVNDLYDLSNVHQLEKRISIGNVHLVYDLQSNFLLQFSDCRRSNVDFHDITISGYCISSENVGNGGVIYLNSCALITVRNVNGSNPVGHYGAGAGTVGGSGYILSLADTTDVSVSDCVWHDADAGSWHAQGTTSATNTSYTNVVTSRVDVHYMHYGRLSYDNCTFAFEAFAGGFGDITHNNVQYIQTYSSTAGNAQRAVQLRTDLAIGFAGSVSWDHCRLDSRYTYDADVTKCQDFLYLGFRAALDGETVPTWIPATMSIQINDLRFPDNIRSIVSCKFKIGRQGSNCQIRLSNMRGRIAADNPAYPLRAGWVTVWDSTSSDTTYELSRLYITECDVQSGRIWPDMVGTVMMSDCNVLADQLQPNNSSTHLLIADCRLYSILANGTGCNSLMIHDCRVDRNRLMTAIATYHRIHDNLIAASPSPADQPQQWNPDN